MSVGHTAKHKMKWILQHRTCLWYPWNCLHFTVNFSLHQMCYWSLLCGWNSSSLSDKIRSGKFWKQEV